MEVLILRRERANHKSSIFCEENHVRDFYVKAFSFFKLKSNQKEIDSLNLNQKKDSIFRIQYPQRIDQF